MTYAELVVEVLKMVDEYSSKGNLVAAAKTADLRYKIPEAANFVTNDLSRLAARLEAKHEIVHNPIATLAQDTSAIQTHEPGVDFSIELIGALSCYFETTGPATIYIEEETAEDTWSVLETITVLSTQINFAAYRRLITASSTANAIRLRFGGSYRYSFRNYILYDIAFPTAAEVQQHGNYIMYALPTDFMVLKNCMVRKNVRQWNDYKGFVYIPEDSTIGFDAKQPGEYIVNYYRKPILLTVSATPADSTVIDVLAEAAPLVALGVTSRILLLDNLTVSTLLWNQYEIGKGSINGQAGITPKKITSMCGW